MATWFVSSSDEKGEQDRYTELFGCRWKVNEFQGKCASAFAKLPFTQMPYGGKKVSYAKGLWAKQSALLSFYQMNIHGMRQYEQKKYSSWKLG
jgi:hypothetical protein